MLKLSRSGWNNVIIFAVMGFILLINLTHNNTETEVDLLSNQEQIVIGENSVILMLTINNNTMIERIGRTWRATPSVIQGQALDQMMMSWEQLSGSIVEAPSDIDMQHGLSVDIALAGYADLLQLVMFDYNDTLLVYNSLSKQWFSLPLALFSQLLPTPVLR